MREGWHVVPALTLPTGEALVSWKVQSKTTRRLRRWQRDPSVCPTSTHPPGPLRRERAPSGASLVPVHALSLLTLSKTSHFQYQFAARPGWSNFNSEVRQSLTIPLGRQTHTALKTCRVFTWLIRRDWLHFAGLQMLDILYFCPDIYILQRWPARYTGFEL